MSEKIKLTRPELKRQRDALSRFRRYLPMLKLKQQQLQMTIRETLAKRRKAADEVKVAEQKVNDYKQLLKDLAGMDVHGLAKPSEIHTTTANVAGVPVPVFEKCDFPKISYSLFSTPPWVDRVLSDLRELNKRRVELDVLDQQYEMLNKELVKIIQRVNLFEKIKIPEAREAIRRIRIHLGDEMTAAVGRAKIAKGKISEAESAAPMIEDLTFSSERQEVEA